MGFQTHRDHFAIDFEKKVINLRLKDLLNSNIPDEKIANKYNLIDTGSWNLTEARKKIKGEMKPDKYITKVLFRLFDKRYCIYSSIIIDRPRQEIQNHILDSDNLCIGIGRQGLSVNDPIWHLITISRIPVDANIFRRGGINLFPLYLYPEKGKLDLGEKTDAPGGRRPNLDAKFIEELSKRITLKFVSDGKGDLKNTFGPEDVFNYIYAVFHAPSYRTRYAEFLKINFPRLPLTSSKVLFRRLCILGQKLVDIHLMEANLEFGVKYPVAGDNEVGKVRYSEIAASPATPRNDVIGKVWINNDQYFENIPGEVWEFQIGGYQVCHKWLKDRKGRKLSYDDLEHYKYIVAAISETIKLMDQIDKTVDSHSGWPIK
jgi:predicted helicase